MLAYLRDMKSWIGFFVGIFLLINLLIWMDRGLSLEQSSLVYMNSLLIVLFVLFITWRVKKETRYTQELEQIMNESDWQEALPTPQFQREQMLNDMLYELSVKQQKKLAKLKESHVVENDYTAAWIHEVKAPLTAMKLLIDSERQNLSIRKIESEWLRIHLLIEQQLYITRLPSLESDYVLEQLTISQLVMNEVKELATWCFEKNIAIDVEGEHLQVVSDQKWCRFILRQILTNAVKYSPMGSTIRINGKQAENGQVMVSIVDEGPGIAPHDLPRIFDKGFTGSTGRLHNAATGLGLYLAQIVAQKIGILLIADSTEGDGTTLRLTFSVENAFDATRK